VTFDGALFDGGSRIYGRRVNLCLRNVSAAAFRNRDAISREGAGRSEQCRATTLKGPGGEFSGPKAVVEKASALEMVG